MNKFFFKDGFDFKKESRCTYIYIYIRGCRGLFACWHPPLPETIYKMADAIYKSSDAI